MSILRRGTHWPLEAEADRLLKESLKGVTSHKAKSDILTPWKERERRRREVYVGSGTPDPALRRGMFHRTLNPAYPHLNSREGVSAPRSNRTGSLQSFVNAQKVNDGRDDEGR